MQLWRLRSGAGDLEVPMVEFQSESKGLRTRRANGISSSLSQSLKAREDLCLSIKTIRKRENSFLLSLFVLFSPSMDCIMPTHIGENNLLYTVC